MIELSAKYSGNGGHNDNNPSFSHDLVPPSVFANLPFNSIMAMRPNSSKNRCPKALFFHPKHHTTYISDTVKTKKIIQKKQFLFSALHILICALLFAWNQKWAAPKIWNFEPESVVFSFHSFAHFSGDVTFSGKPFLGLERCTGSSFDLRFVILSKLFTSFALSI